MRPVQNSDDAAFGALRTRAATGAALDSCQHVVPVHRVFDRAGRDKDVTIELWHGSVRHDKTITVVMEEQASFDFVVTRKRGPFDLLRLVRTRLLAGRFPIRLAAREAVSPAGQFLDRTTFREF